MDVEGIERLKNEINDLYSSFKTIIIPPIIHPSKSVELINYPVKQKLPIRRDISLADCDYIEQFEIVNEMLNSLDFERNNNNNNVKEMIKSFLEEYNMVLSNILDSVSSYIQFQQDELNIMKENYDKLLIKSIVNQDKINVYIRCKKPENDEEDDLKIIEINNENEKEIVFYGNADKFKYYEFDNCFNEYSSQSDIFNELNYVIPSLLDGYYISIISYGIKGSGKSYTLFGESDKILDKKLMMNGKINVDSNIGLSYRILIDLYNYLVFNNYNYDSEMKVSVVELKDDEVFDVLHWYNDDDEEKKEEREDFKLNINYSNKNIEFPEINEVVINNKRDIVRILNICRENRNKTDEIASSLFIYVNLKIKSVDKVLEGKLTIVDMIDSDKVTTKSPMKIKEKSEYLYSSISCFNNIISHLVENRATINYKDNKLTMLLRDSFNGKSKTVLLCNIFTTLKYSDEINSTLSFANSLKNIQYGGKVNNFVNYANQINEIRRLKKTIEDIKNGNGMNEEKDSEILLLKDMIDDLKEQIELYKGKDEEIISLMKDNKELNEKLVEFEENKMEIVRLKERINELEKNEEIIKEKDEEINQLNIQNEILNKTIESNKATENSLKERIMKQNDQLTKSIANTNELKDMVEIQNQSLIEMKLITETLQKRMKDMELDLDKEKEIEKEKDNKIKILEELIRKQPVRKDCQTQTVIPQPRKPPPPNQRQIPPQLRQQNVGKVPVQQQQPSVNQSNINNSQPQLQSQPIQRQQQSQSQIQQPHPQPQTQQRILQPQQNQIHQPQQQIRKPPISQPQHPPSQQQNQQQRPQQRIIPNQSVQRQSQTQQRILQPQQKQIRKPPLPQQRQIQQQSTVNEVPPPKPKPNINPPQNQLKQIQQPQPQTQQRAIIPPRQSINKPPIQNNLSTNPPQRPLQQQQRRIPPPPQQTQPQIRKLPIPQSNINKTPNQIQANRNIPHPQQQQIRKPPIQQKQQPARNQPIRNIPQPRPRIQPPHNRSQPQAQPFRNYLSPDNKIY